MANVFPPEQSPAAPPGAAPRKGISIWVILSLIAVVLICCCFVMFFIVPMVAALI